MGDQATRRESPAVAVAGLPWQRHGVTLEEHALLGYLNLRGNPGDQGFLDALAGAGVSLPLSPNTTQRSGELLALWLGPDEWLLIAPGEQVADDLKTRLDAALTGRFYALADISSAHTTLRLQGARTLELIRSGVTLDVHPRVFAPGQCAQTNCSHATVVLCPVDDAPTVDLIVRRSFADYLARWLMDWRG